MSYKFHYLCFMKKKKVYVVSSNGIPVGVYSSLRMACDDLGLSYVTTWRHVKGGKLVYGEHTISFVQYHPIIGRGRKV